MSNRNGSAQDSASTPIGSVTGVDGKRVRGTLKAAKRAADALEGGFTRDQLFARVEEDNPALAGKISPEAQRSTMRTLIKEGWILADNVDLGTYRAVRLV